MDYDKEFDDLQSCMKNFNIDLASDLLSNTVFMKQNVMRIIHILGEGLTENNFNNKSDYFNFCEEQLLKIAQTENGHNSMFDILELIETDYCNLSSSVLIAVTSLEGIENPSVIYLEYLLSSIFNRLNEVNETDLKDVLMSILHNLIKLNKHFHQEQSVLYHFTKVTFLVLRADIDPNEFIDMLSKIIIDPYFLLEQEFEEMEDKTYLASFFYLYFKTGISWGPKVYNQFYVFEKCSYLAISVFQNDDFGKSFAKLILTKLKDNEIPLRFLNKRHEEFLIEAAQSSMLNEQLHLRKNSFESLLLFIKKVCSEAQYKIFKQIFSKPFDSCIKAQMIISMRDLVLSKMRSNQDPGYFQGTRFLELIKLCCNISDGPKCNIVENKEHILATITLMYGIHTYLSLTHYSHFGKLLNIGTEFYDCAEQFIVTVQNAIDYTNSNFELESNKLDKNIVDDEEERKASVLGLSKLSKKEKHDILSQYNTTSKLVQANLNMFKEITKARTTTELSHVEKV